MLNDSEGHITDVTNPDGSIDRVTTARDNDVGLVDSRRVDANGNLVGAPTRSLQLHDVHPSLISDLYQVTGQTPPADVGSDLRLTFSEPQLELIRQAALERLADKVAVNGERPTPEQIAASLADRDGVVEFNDVHYDFGGLETLLGAAQTPDDILLALYYGGLEADNILYSLTDLLRDRVTNLGPIIETPSCSTDPCGPGHKLSLTPHASGVRRAYRPRTMRCERGQTAAEYLGVLLVADRDRRRAGDHRRRRADPYRGRAARVPDRRWNLPADVRAQRRRRRRRTATWRVRS